MWKEWKGNMVKVLYVIGTRPEIIRSANVIKTMRNDPDIDLCLVNTGQHYDVNMNQVFMEDLGVGKADINIPYKRSVISPHAHQTSQIMNEMEQEVMRTSPDVVVVFGDTNGTLAAALATRKLRVPLVHIEAGCREYDDVPEEINRRIVDHCSNYNLCVSTRDVANLMIEGIYDNVYNVGDPLYSVFCATANGVLCTRPLFLEHNYILLTMHRDINVDNFDRFESIVCSLDNLGIPILFPIHPRTQKMYISLKASLKNFTAELPCNYATMLNYVKHSSLVITDSGGLQKEAFWFGKPCITLRKVSGWYDLVNAGVNFLSPDANDLETLVRGVYTSRGRIATKIQAMKNPYYKEDTNERIIKYIKEAGGNGPKK